MDGVPTGCSMPSAVLALACGSRSMSRTRRPCKASAAAMFTALVVLPTPPFWLATVSTRVPSGRGHRSWRTLRTCTACAASRAMGVSNSVSRETAVPAGALDVSRETAPGAGDSVMSPLPYWASSIADKHHHPCRLQQHPGAQLLDGVDSGTVLPQGGLAPRHFGGGRRPLEREQSTGFREQRQAPPRQPIERGDSPRNHPVAAAGRLPDVPILGAAANQAHRIGEPELAEGLGQKLDAPQHRLNHL